MRAKITKWAKTTPQSQGWLTIDQLNMRVAGNPPDHPENAVIEAYVDAHQSLADLAVLSGDVEYLTTMDEDGTRYTVIGFPDDEQFDAYEENRASIYADFLEKRTALSAILDVEITVYPRITVDSVETLTLEEIKQHV
jgi:hypothetical protein